MASRIYRQDLLKGKRVLITGGGTGIGRATALEMASLGADVAIVGRRPEPLQKVAQEIENLGRRALVLPTDVREPEQVTHMVSEVKAALGSLDVLVNNAGGQFVQPSESLTPKGWNAVIQENLNSTFYVSREVAVQCMIPQRSGCIVNMLINMWRGAPAVAHSGAARAGIENLTKTLAIEWARYKIRVNAVAPGTVRTEGLAQYPPEIVKRLRSVIPLKREGRPEEVAWLIVYLCSEASDWITGESVCIDGGSQHWGSLWEIGDEEPTASLP